MSYDTWKLDTPPSYGNENTPSTEELKERYWNAIDYKKVAEALVDVINDCVDAPGTYSCRPLFNSIVEGLGRMDCADVAALAVGWDVMPSLEDWLAKT